MMRDVYTITRWDNGWTIDVKTRDGLKNRSGVFEDEAYEDTRYAQAESLMCALYEAFDFYVLGDEECGITVDIEDIINDEEKTEETQGEEDDSTG